jgi:branched-chain amino acid transport system substrate-binding protein
MAITAHTTQQKEFRIGGIFSLTGHLSWVGTCKRKAAELRAEMINQAGGVKGHTIRLLARDDQSSPDLAARAAENLITRQGVSAIIGTASLTISAAIASIVDVYQIPTIISSAFDLDHRKHFFLFNTSHKTEVVVEHSFQRLQAMGISRIALLMPVNPLGELGSAVGNKLCQKYGIRVLVQEKFSPDGEDIKSCLARLREYDPQAIFAYATGKPAANVARNMAALNMNIPLVVSHGNANPGFLREVSCLPVPILVPSGQTMSPKAIAKDNPCKTVVTKFNENHFQRYGEPADYCGAAASDALGLAAAGFRVSGSFHGPDLREAIETMGSFEGMEGVYRFSPDDHHGRLLEQMVLLQLKNGRWLCDKAHYAESVPPKAKPSYATQVIEELNRQLPGHVLLPVLPDEPLGAKNDANHDPHRLPKPYYDWERSMVAALRMRDTVRARESLCQLTSLLLCRHINNSDLLKVWVTELLSTLCQALVEGKAESEKIMRVKLDTISQLAMAENPETVCLRFLVAVEKLLGDIDAQGETPTHRVLRKVFAFIEQNYDMPLRINHIAHAVCLSPSHLSHLIRKEFNSTLGSCIARARIEKAKQLLRNLDVPISRVALEVGYPDQSYFTKIFKKYEKSTPAEFRRDSKKQHTATA